MAVFILISGKKKHVTDFVKHLFIFCDCTEAGGETAVGALHFSTQDFTMISDGVD